MEDIIFVSLVTGFLIGVFFGRSIGIPEKKEEKMRVHVKEFVGYKRNRESDLPFDDEPIYEEYDADVLSMTPVNDRGQSYLLFFVKKDDGTIHNALDVKIID